MKKMLSVVLSLLLCLWSIPISMIGVAEEWKPFEGSGTADDPYQIDSAYKLRLLSELVNADETALEYYDKCYLQTKDIDLKNENFTPIGTYTEDNKGTGFIGDYNGNYNNIYNLYIERAKNYDGLFGWIYGGKIENLTVYGNVNCPGSGAVGGIVGEIGSGSGKSVKNCAFYGDITGKYNVGGISGGIWHTGTIENCYFNGSVTNTSDNENAGGIVGMVFPGDEASISGHTVVKNCYAVSNKNSSNLFGGIVGHTTKGTNEGNIIEIENNYYLNTMADTGITGDYTSGCSKLSSELMKSADELLGSPFIHNDDETVNNGYPIFEWQGKPYEFFGSGTDDDPYQISCKEDLFAFKQMVSSPYFKGKYYNANYVQTKDIDLNNEPWNPSGFYFEGIYNGNYHNIKNLYVNTNKKYIGLFGVVRWNGIVRNLIVSGEVTGGYSTGGIAGELQFGGIIENCAFIGDVNCITDGGTGGIAAYIWQGGTIRNCYHNGKVNGITIGIGGIVGRIHTSGEERSKDVLIENCYHVGELTGSGEVGAIVGLSDFGDYSNKTEIKNCYYIKDDCSTAINRSYTSCDTLSLSQNLLKRAADDLGDAYISNTDSSYNGGYPIFYWAVRGDINFDGKNNIADAVTLQKYLMAGIQFNQKQYDVADLDSDGKVNVFDMVTMRQLIVDSNIV